MQAVPSAAMQQNQNQTEQQLIEYLQTLSFNDKRAWIKRHLNATNANALFASLPVNKTNKNTFNYLSEPFKKLSTPFTWLGALIEASVLSTASSLTILSFKKLKPTDIHNPLTWFAIVVGVIGVFIGTWYKKRFITGGADNPANADHKPRCISKCISVVWAAVYEGADAASTIYATFGSQPLYVLISPMVACFALKAAKALFYERPVVLGDTDNKHGINKNAVWIQNLFMFAQEAGSFFIGYLHYKTTKMLLTEAFKACLGGTLSGGVSWAITVISLLTGLAGHYFMNAYDLQGSRVTAEQLKNKLKDGPCLRWLILVPAFAVRWLTEKTVEQFPAARLACCTFQTIGLACLYAVPIITNIGKFAFGAKTFAAAFTAMAVANPGVLVGIGIGLIVIAAAITYKKHLATKKYAAEATLEMVKQNNTGLFSNPQANAASSTSSSSEANTPSFFNEGEAESEQASLLTPGATA